MGIISGIAPEQGAPGGTTRHAESGRSLGPQDAIEKSIRDVLIAALVAGGGDPRRARRRMEGRRKIEVAKRERLRLCLQSDVVDLNELRGLTWDGLEESAGSLSSSSLMTKTATTTTGSVARPVGMDRPGGGGGVRGVVWQLLLEYLPEESANRDAVLEEMRHRYRNVVAELTSHPGETAPEGDHPLSSGQGSHWARFFYVQEAERLIALDVKRTHPNVPRFRDLEGSMNRILLAYSLKHMSVGTPAGQNDGGAGGGEYRQGMHELLAPVLFVFASRGGDSDAPNLEDTEADAYHCFCGIMSEMAPLYSQQGETLNRELRRLNEVLQLRDPKLYQHLKSIGVEARLYGLRWIRLWLAHEFALTGLLTLWDSILSATPRLPWLGYLCVAMVIAVRDRLLQSDFTNAAHILLRYSQNNIPIETILRIADALRSGANLCTKSTPPRASILPQ